MFAKYEAFNNDENSGKFTNRMLALIGMHDFISNAGKKVNMKEDILLQVYFR
ncbi:hypothetical protein AAHB46_12390 [Bacillus paranthracis]